MTLRSVFKLSEKFIIDNAPTLLSAIAATGVGTVAYLTGKATFKAARIISDEQDVREIEMDTKDKVKLTWKCYIPPALAVGGTVGCIVFANSISASRLAAMAAAYKVSEKQYAEYKDKVKEILGDKSDEKVTNSIHADAVSRTPPPWVDIDSVDMLADDALYPGTRRQWCFDLYSGRYFKSDIQTLRSYQNDINKQILEDTRVSLTDFYEMIGLTPTKQSSEIGWTLSNPMDIDFGSQIADGNGGVPVVVVDFERPLSALRDYKFCADEND